MYTCVFCVIGVLSCLAIIDLAEEERAGCFTLIVLWLSVLGALGWSAVCDFSWAYSLFNTVDV